jgi:hypothetical protein
MKQEMCHTYCDIRWYKSYNYHFGWIPAYTQKIGQIINHLKEFGVPCIASPPTIDSPVYTKCTDLFYFYWVMKAPTPVMMGDFFPEINQSFIVIALALALAQR